MQIENLTAFQHLKFSKSDNRGLEFGVVVVKATSSFDEDGNCITSDDQERLNVEEITFGKPDKSSLRQPNDLVGYKPSTDIIINAVAYSPNKVPSATWEVSVELYDANRNIISKKLRITGPRYWIPIWKRELTDKEKNNWRDYRDLFVKWELSEPNPIDKLPIQYEYAYGGFITKPTDDNCHYIEEVYEFNPVGIGYIDRDWTDHTKPIPAPQIEHADDPIIDPYKHYQPAGFGAIQRAWLPRRSLGGTFDQNWIDTVWPKWPADYDFAYNNAASEGFYGNGFLKLPIVIKLKHLHHKNSEHVIKIQTQNIQAHYNTKTGDFYSLPYMDTLHLELTKEDDFYNHLFVIWRLIYKMDDTLKITIAVANNEIIDKDIYIPHPQECGIYSDALEKPNGK